MAFPTTSVLDPFTGNDNDDLPTYSGNWTGVAGFSNNEIQSNAATGTADATNCWNYWNVGTFSNNVEAYVTKTTLDSTNSYSGVFYCSQNESTTIDCYWAEIDTLSGDDTAYIYRIDDTGIGSTMVTATGINFGVGDKIGAEFTNGDTHQLYIDTGSGWTATGSSATDSAYTSGHIGISTIDTTVRLDDFGGGTIVSAATNQNLLLLGVS